MKLIIAGSRTLNPGFDIINAAIYDNKLIVTEFVSGGASGVDKAGEEYANYSQTKLTLFKANWDTHGKGAGPIRNRKMALYADALLLIWDGKSRGSLNMKLQMQNLDKPIYEVILD